MYSRSFSACTLPALALVLSGLLLPTSEILGQEQHKISWVDTEPTVVKWQVVVKDPHKYWSKNVTANEVIIDKTTFADFKDEDGAAWNGFVRQDPPLYFAYIVRGFTADDNVYPTEEMAFQSSVPSGLLVVSEAAATVSTGVNTTVTVTGLTKGTVYYGRVTPETRAGAGMVSSVTAGVEAREVPCDAAQVVLGGEVLPRPQYARCRTYATWEDFWYCHAGGLCPYKTGELENRLSEEGVVELWVCYNHPCAGHCAHHPSRRGGQGSGPLHAAPHPRPHGPRLCEEGYQGRDDLQQGYRGQGRPRHRHGAAAQSQRGRGRQGEGGQGGPGGPGARAGGWSDVDGRF